MVELAVAHRSSHKRVPEACRLTNPSASRSGRSHWSWPAVSGRSKAARPAARIVQPRHDVPAQGAPKFHLLGQAFRPGRVELGDGQLANPAQPCRTPCELHVLRARVGHGLVGMHPRGAGWREPVPIEGEALAVPECNGHGKCAHIAAYSGASCSKRAESAARLAEQVAQIPSAMHAQFALNFPTSGFPVNHCSGTRCVRRPFNAPSKSVPNSSAIAAQA